MTELARPFEPPTASTPFRFRYTSYLGESHPATNKVVVQFSPSDLGLTSTQRAKLIKLAGPRYNPSSDLIKLSTEQFDTQTQNKRFLGDTIQNLLTEAKDARDTFEDVPFDFRHHKPKVRHEFPAEWVLTAERKAYLEQKRGEAARLQDIKAGNGELVDGKTVIDTSLPLSPRRSPCLLRRRGGSKMVRLCVWISVSYEAVLDMWTWRSIRDEACSIIQISTFCLLALLLSSKAVKYISLFRSYMQSVLLALLLSSKTVKHYFSSQRRLIDTRIHTLNAVC